MNWTEEQDATLRQLWSDGLSTAKIGEKMGVTKNAVIGRAHRLALAPRQGAPGWSREDIAFFRAHAAWSDGRIGDELGKNAKTVARARIRYQIGRPEVIIPRDTRPKPWHLNKPKVSTQKQPFLPWQWTPSAEPSRPKWHMASRGKWKFAHADAPGCCQWFEGGKNGIQRQCTAPASAFRDNGTPCPEGPTWCLKHRRKVYQRVSVREAA